MLSDESEVAAVGAILAAGLGTRLRPLTLERPKPLVPVAGVPLIEYALDQLVTAGIGQIGVNGFHLRRQLSRALAHRSEAIAYIEESKLQGTGGGVRGIAAVLPRTTLIAINGDALFDFDLTSILARHRARGAMATLVLRDVPPDAPFGRVGMAPDGRLHRIAEIEGLEPSRVDLQWGAYTGVQIVEPALVDALPSEGPCDVLRTAYRRRLEEGALICGDFVPPSAPWFDVGTVERYLEANFAVLRGDLFGGADRCSATASVDPTAIITGPCWIGAGAHIGAGARIGPHVVADRDSQVADGAIVRNSVIWPGVRVSGRVIDEVRWSNEAQPLS